MSAWRTGCELMEEVTIARFQSLFASDPVMGTDGRCDATDRMGVVREGGTLKMVQKCLPGASRNGAAARRWSHMNFDR